MKSLIISDKYYLAFISQGFFIVTWNSEYEFSLQNIPRGKKKYILLKYTGHDTSFISHFEEKKKTPLLY